MNILSRALSLPLLLACVSGCFPTEVDEAIDAYCATDDTCERYYLSVGDCRDALEDDWRSIVKDDEEGCISAYSAELQCQAETCEALDDPRVCFMESALRQYVCHPADEYGRVLCATHEEAADTSLCASACGSSLTEQWLPCTEDMPGNCVCGESQCELGQLCCDCGTIE